MDLYTRVIPVTIMRVYSFPRPVHAEWTIVHSEDMVMVRKQKGTNMKRIDFNQNWVFNGKQISLPHDAMLYAGRSAGSPSGTGGAFYEGGTYHYEKPSTYRATGIRKPYGWTSRVFIGMRSSGSMDRQPVQMPMDIRDLRSTVRHI